LEEDSSRSCGSMEAGEEVSDLFGAGTVSADTGCGLGGFGSVTTWAWAEDTVKKIKASKRILGVDFLCIPGFLVWGKLKGIY
jgi:hypothetical protein